MPNRDEIIRFVENFWALDDAVDRAWDAEQAYDDACVAVELLEDARTDLERMDIDLLRERRTDAFREMRAARAALADAAHTLYAGPSC